ncbi:MAG: hypothetical protein P8X46_12275 [Nitrospirales bacterium]
MRTITTENFMTSHPEPRWVKKFGWYGVAFFIMKGALWLITPFIIYAVN